MAVINLENKVENFSELSDEECADLLKNNLLETLEGDVSLEWEMITKFIVNVYPEREPLRKVLSLAFRSNEQLLGNYAVKEWLNRYRKTYKNIERTPNTFYEFATHDSEAKKLEKINQLKLMKLLRMYDYLLVEPIFEISDTIFEMLRFPMFISKNNQIEQLSAAEKTNFYHPAAQPAPPKIENLALNTALKQYPALGEQLITSEKMKLQNFPEPVRPSIKNWLADYTFNLGYENRGSIQRGTYLFQNTNTRRLSPGDRQKLQYILKAYDENLPVPINKNTSQIVFSEVAFGGNPAEIKPVIQTEEKDQNIKFSYPQKLPYERKDNPNIIKPESNSQPLPKNIVNLRDE